MSEQNFEVGDKVRRVATMHYTIKEIGEWIVAEDEDGTTYEFDDHEIELAAPEAPIQPSGDVVKKVERLIWQSKIIERLVQYAIEMDTHEVRHDKTKIDIPTFFSDLRGLNAAITALESQGYNKEPVCSVAEMETSAGMDYYVHIRVGERTLTPHMFKHRSKAEYEVAEWKWLLNGEPKPEMGDWLDRFKADEAANPIPEYSRKPSVKGLVEALKECEEVFRLGERPAFPDPAHHAEVKALGERIGFGALMSTASAGWAEVLKEKGYPAGGQFVAGPCHGTLLHTLKMVRAALAANGEE